MSSSYQLPPKNLLPFTLAHRGIEHSTADNAITYIPSHQNFVKPTVYQVNSRTIQLQDTDCGLACIHTMVGFYLHRQRDILDTAADNEQQRGMQATDHSTIATIEDDHQGQHLENETNDRMTDAPNCHFHPPPKVHDETRMSQDSLQKVEPMATSTRSIKPNTIHPLPSSLKSYYPTFLPKKLPHYMIQHELDYLLRIEHTHEFQQELLRRKNLKKNPQEMILVWTIDYAYYLKHNVTNNFLFCTQQIGVDPQYENLDFYAEVIQDDIVRVNHLFDEAQRDGIPIRKVHLSLEVLKRMIHRDHIYAILVVDSNRMKCLSCEYVPSESDDEENGDDGSSSLSSSDESWEEIPTDPDTDPDVDAKDFAGHFVLLVDSNDTQIFYKDSSIFSCNTCVCDAKRLDRARLAFGTDEDILLVCMDPGVNLEKILQKELKREAKEKQRKEQSESVAVVDTL